MTPPFSRRDRAAEAASYADRLQADLVSLAGMLAHYDDPLGRIEELRQEGERCSHRLDAISKRIDGLGGAGAPGDYPLSDQEHAALDAARDLRTRMMDTLSDLQQSERATGKPLA